MISLLSSCIFDSANDKFYRTLWVSEKTAFSETGQAVESASETEAGSSTSGRITLEFLCGGSIRVTANGAAGTYGTYQSYGNTAHFVGLTLVYLGDSATIIIEEAHRKGDLLLVSWHREGSHTSYSTRFVRSSSYE